MKHLKLFEAFNETDKVYEANSLFIEYFLFNSFVKDHIIVEYRDNRHIDTFAAISTMSTLFSFFNDPHRDRAFKPHRHRAFKVLEYSCNTGVDRLETTSYTLWYFQNAFLGYISKSTVEKIVEYAYQVKGVHRAAKRYIDYLKMTPDKKNLLKEWNT